LIDYKSENTMPLIFLFILFQIVDWINVFVL